MGGTGGTNMNRLAGYTYNPQYSMSIIDWLEERKRRQKTIDNSTPLENEDDFKNDQEFADYTVKLLSDDNFYLDLKKKMFEKRKINTWNKIADEWIDFFDLN